MNGRYDLVFTSNQCAMELIPNVVAIDSRNRDDVHGTSSSSYAVTLPHPYRDAVSIELVYANVPNGNYNVTSNNNKLYIRASVDNNAPALNLVPDVITINPGIYTIGDIYQALINELDAQYVGANFALVNDPITRRVTISAVVGFSLYFRGASAADPDGSVYYHHQPQSIAPLLGFSASNLQSQVNGPQNEVTGAGSYNVEMDGAVTLHLENMERCDSNNDKLSGAFCVLPLTTVSPLYGLLRDGDTIQNDDKAHYFIQPQKLARLRIEFKDWQGNIYDFNGYDHLLVFKIMTLGNSRRVL